MNRDRHRHVNKGIALKPSQPHGIDCENAIVLVFDGVVRDRCVLDWCGAGRYVAENRDAGWLFSLRITVRSIAGKCVVDDDVVVRVLAGRMAMDGDPGYAVMHGSVAIGHIAPSGRTRRPREEANPGRAIAVRCIVQHPVLVNASLFRRDR